MAPDQRNQLNRLLAEDAGLQQELEVLGGPKFPAAPDAVLDLLQQRIAHLKSEISDAKWKKLAATGRPSVAGVEVFQRRDDISPLISEAERRQMASR